MATYKKIQEYIRNTYGYSVKPCWIADMKEKCGLPRRNAYNRYDPTKRVCPCPENKEDAIKSAFTHFNML
ncbi:MAG: hypothetical protein KBS52_04845 [Clostridiales bacterium]|nr:hypothetical protein [Candidatus Equinaster intestinalis]